MISTLWTQLPVWISLCFIGKVKSFLSTAPDTCTCRNVQVNCVYTTSNNFNIGKSMGGEDGGCVDGGCEDGGCEVRMVVVRVVAMKMVVVWMVVVRWCLSV